MVKDKEGRDLYTGPQWKERKTRSRVARVKNGGPGILVLQMYCAMCQWKLGCVGQCTVYSVQSCAKCMFYSR